jgi:hypothetical protein
VITRGALPVHKARSMVTSRPDGIPFLHTTSISATGVVTPLNVILPRGCERVIEGPCVLLPRVGNPALSKVALYEGPAAVLSDCLYSVRGTANIDVRSLYALIRASWPQFAALYGGSCAPFLRLDDLAGLAAELLDHEPEGHAVATRASLDAA